MQENEKIILEEILKKSRWYEKIIVIIFKKIILSVYHLGRIKASNSFYG